MKHLIFSFLFLVAVASRAQVFTNENVKEIVKKGVDHIYNAAYDSALMDIQKASSILPGHPVIPLMEAMNMLWSNIPLISDSLFHEMRGKLELVVENAEKIDPKMEQPEFIYFAMAARGLLAENYAERDQYLKAVGEASKAYSLLKKGFDLSEKNNEFLLTTGLYNYFRDMYPEKHPVYRPLLWFFRAGDASLGIDQLEEAASNTLFSRVEAQIYLSYIYLRFEYHPLKAQKYLFNLTQEYPNNYYAKAKYLESIANPLDFNNVPMKEINQLMHHRSNYFQLAGFVFMGYYLEIIRVDDEKAFSFYLNAKEIAEILPDHGEYFKSMGYLGLARIEIRNKRYRQAKNYLELCLEFAETRQVIIEAKKLLSNI